MANVLSLVPYKIFPAKFGGQKCIAQFNEYFSEYHSLYCVTVKANNPSAASYELFNVLSDSRFRYVNIFYFFKLKKIIRENEITHIVMEHPYYGWLALLLKFFCKIKLIVRSHNIEAERFKTVGKWWWKILWLYERYVHRHADHTFCITDVDCDYFISRYGLSSTKLSLITYGIPWNSLPSIEEEAEAKSRLLKKHVIEKGTTLYMFNGALGYRPNYEALLHILEDINPLFMEKGVLYKIIICGKDLPATLDSLSAYGDKNIIYAGFVDDINLYFKGVDIFINPVTDGGGIKTKLVEALGFNLTSVSTENGAIGIDANLCNGKLILTGSEDWQAFADSMFDAIHVTQSMPPDFFNHFYWDNIARKAAVVVDDLEERRGMEK